MGKLQASQFDGKCETCNTPFKKGDQIYLQKDQTTGKWIKCKDEECFKMQGGSIEEKKQFQGRKRLSAEEARTESQKIWAYSLEEANKMIPTPAAAYNTASVDPNIQNKLKQEQLEHEDKVLGFAKLFYKGIVELMK